MFTQESHIISVILNVAQDVDEDWPLYIKDHRGRGRQILLQPGEMIYYESAKLVHYIYIYIYIYMRKASQLA